MGASAHLHARKERVACRTGRLVACAPRLRVRHDAPLVVHVARLRRLARRRGRRFLAKEADLRRGRRRARRPVTTLSAGSAAADAVRTGGVGRYSGSRTQRVAGPGSIAAAARRVVRARCLAGKDRRLARVCTRDTGCGGAPGAWVGRPRIRTNRIQRRQQRWEREESQSLSHCSLLASCRQSANAVLHEPCEARSRCRAGGP